MHSSNIDSLVLITSSPRGPAADGALLLQPGPCRHDSGDVSVGQESSRRKQSSLLQRHNFLVVLCIFFLTLADRIGRLSALGAEDLSSHHVRKVKKNSISRRLSCNGPTTSFVSNITLDYSIVCAALAPSDIAILQDGIMEAYNDLLQNQYCDPFSRRISNVTYVYETPPNADGSQVVVHFLVAGTCQGCDTNSSSPHHMSFFDEKFADLGMSQHNVLEDGDETSACPCPVDAVANRAATQDEFLTLYESVLARDSQDLICVTGTSDGVLDGPTAQPSSAPSKVAVDCPVDLSTQLTSKVVVTLSKDSTMQTSYEGIGQSLMDAYNSFINTTYSTCQKLKYRQITNITIDSDSTFGNRGMKGRQMQDILPTTAQQIFYQVEGGCAGCDTEQLFFDPNLLSQDDFVESYCRAIDADLDCFSEIVAVDCPSNPSSFEDAVIIEFVPEGVDSYGLSNDNLLMQELAEIYVETYNNLTREYSDPYARQLTSAKIVTVGENNTFGNIPVVIELAGTCSNCDGLDLGAYDVPSSILALPNGTANDSGVIFFEDIEFRRFLLSASPSGRSIQGVDSSCYVPAHPVGTRGVYETEFLDAYRIAINETAQITTEESGRQLQVVEAETQPLGLEVAECQFGTTFRT